MNGLKGERTLMRIHVEEQDKFEGKPVYECIVQRLRERHFAGATAYRALEGFGATAHLHHHTAWAITTDSPIIVECIDADEKIRSILPELETMIGGGVMTLERVRVILYRKDIPPEERDAASCMDVTGSWQVGE